MVQESDTEKNDQDTNARMALGLVIGMALGVALGVALDSIPIGIAIGAGIGVSLGAAFSGRRPEPSRPLTVAGVVLVLAGVLVLAVMMHLVLPRWWCGYPVLNLLPGC
jgi:multidrug transporter EmrE-like cation transporter